MALICAAAMLLSMGALSFAKDEARRVQPIQIIALLEMTDPAEVNPFEVITRAGVAKMLSFAFCVHPENDEALAYSDIKETDRTTLILRRFPTRGLWAAFRTTPSARTETLRGRNL